MRAACGRTGKDSLGVIEKIVEVKPKRRLR